MYVLQFHDFYFSSSNLKIIIFSRGSSSSQDQQTESSTPRITFKKFNRFSRPDIRQSLLQKILGKGKGKNTLDPEEAEKIKEEQKSKQLLDEEEDSITVSENIFFKKCKLYTSLITAQYELKQGKNFPKNSVFMKQK